MLKSRLSNTFITFYFCTTIAIFGCSGGVISTDAEVEQINELLDNWHHAASVADEEVFFGSMSEECIYLGTDISEKWKRDELRKWSEKFFNKSSAWDFKPYEREIYQYGNTAWFDEKLETWMGECRGSGVLKKVDAIWKLEHYHLSVTVPNEKINGFLELVQDSTLN